MPRKVEDWEKFKKVRNQLTICFWKSKLDYFEEMSKHSAKNQVDRLLGSRNRRVIDLLKFHGGMIINRR